MVPRISVPPWVAACTWWLLAACGSTSEPEAKPNFGIISVGSDSATWWGFANYGEPGEALCKSERFGSCVVQRPCETEGPVQRRTFEAGTVTVQGTLLPFEVVSYSGPLPGTFTAGDAIDMAATGSADVPAHHGTVVIPESVVPREPSFTAAVSLDRASDFEVSWTPVSDGSVSVTVTVLTEPFAHSLNCFAPATDGRLSVPSEALQELPPTSDVAPGRVFISQGNTLALRPEGWEIYLSVPGVGGASTAAEIY